MKSRIYLDNPAAVDRFYRGRERMIYIKNTLFLSNTEITQRLKVRKSTVIEFFKTSEEPPATVIMQEKVLDKMISEFGLNPNWVYNSSRKRFRNIETMMKKLSREEICKIAIDTPQKRWACVNRFEKVYKAFGLKHEDLAALAGCSKAYISQILKQNDPGEQVNYINMMLAFCKKYKISSKWLFLGIGSPLLPHKGGD